MLPALLTAFSPRRNLAALLTRPSGTFTSIDGFRAVAMLSVVGFHVVWLRGEYVDLAAWHTIVNDPFLALGLRGDLGVDVFFVISGFLISHLLIVEYKESGTISLPRFYFRRAIRLLPAYYVILGIVWVLQAQEGFACDTLWANVLYVNNFISAERQCMPWAWSLAVEEQFYIVFPLMLLLLYCAPRRYQLGMLLLVLAIGAVIRGVVNITTNQQIPIISEPWVDQAGFISSINVYVKPYMRYGAILCGVIVAYLCHYHDAVARLERSKKMPTIGLIVAAIGIIIVVAPPVRSPETHWPSFVAWLYLTLDRIVFSAAIGYIVLLSLCSTGPGRPLNAVFSAPFWYPITQLAYSTYLVHLIVITGCYRYVLDPTPLSPLAVLGAFVVCASLSMLTALVVYLTIERPGMALRSLLSARPATRATPSVSAGAAGR
jgi:peptidoglycan/LPS O-acetylase OafA/YrhL